MSHMTMDDQASILQKLEEVKAERDDLAHDLTALEYELRAVRYSEEALAAHLERIRQARHMQYPTEDFSLSNWVNGTCKAVDEAPFTSLTRRDLLKQAEALEELGDSWDWGRHPNHKDLRNIAKKKRRQAENLPCPL